MPSFENEDLVLSFNDEVIARFDVSGGNLHLGGQGRDGDLLIKDSDNVTRITLSGEKAQIFLGSEGHDGNLIIRDKEGRDTVFFDGDTGTIRLGTNGQDGDMSVSDNQGRETIKLNGQNGQLILGTDGHDGNLVVRGSTGQTTVFINGDAGDITLRNADFAEDFDVAVEATAIPGTVMCLASDGRLEACDAHADTRVVGVVSGAGGTSPGLVLDRQTGVSARAPIALVGKVGVFVDPEAPELVPGDVLTSAARTGCATRADYDTPPEAILGRMLRSHSPGMVVMLVRS